MRTGEPCWLSLAQAIPGDSCSISLVNTWKAASPVSRPEPNTCEYTQAHTQTHTKCPHVYDHVFTCAQQYKNMCRCQQARVCTSVQMYTHVYKHTLSLSLALSPGKRWQERCPLCLVCSGEGLRRELVRLSLPVILAPTDQPCPCLATCVWDE